MYPGAIQLFSVLIFAVCFYHSWRNEGKSFAQQWFGIGYLFALLYQVVLVQLGVISYSDRILQFGSAPTLVSLLLPAIYYVSFTGALRLTSGNQLTRALLTASFLAPALSLPVEATALAFDWWSFPSQSRTFLDGVPFFVPISWGFSAALFCAFILGVRRIRLRGSGQLFALVLGTPLMTGIALLLVVLSQVIVAIVGSIPGDAPLNLLLASLLLAYPIALAVGLQRRRAA